MSATITKKESRRRFAADKKTFPIGGIDRHNDVGKPCEICGKDETRGHCIEDSDCAYVCTHCWWVRADRKINMFGEG